MKINKKTILAGLLPATLALGGLQAAFSAETLVKETTVVTACGKLFDLDSNAAGLTATERAKIVQRNLDNALIHAKDRSASAVHVEMMNNNPIVTLDHFYLVTADGNSAARNRMTQMQLAEKWANNIRTCLADAKAVEDYVAMLTGNYPKVATIERDNIAVLTSDMLMPISLANPISTLLSSLGDKVEAVISEDVPLGPTFTTYIPAGTVAVGSIVDPRKYYADYRYPGSNKFPGKDTIGVQFDYLRTPDGKTIPIDGHVLGGRNDWRMVHARPVTAFCCGNNSAAIHTDAIVKLHVNPGRGRIVGAWKGIPANLTQASRLILDRDFPLEIGTGEQMLLQLNAPTVVAVNGGSM